MLEKGERARPRVEEVPWREPVAAAPRKGFPVVGCLVRLVLLVILLIVVALFGLFLLMGGAFQGLIGELGTSTQLVAGAPEQRPPAFATTIGVLALKPTSRISALTA